MLCGVTATLGSNPSATATAARPHWGRAVLLCPDGVCGGLVAPTDLRPPRGLPARFGRPRCELRSARRLVVRTGPAGLAAASGRGVCVLSGHAPPPTGTAAAPSGALHTCGAGALIGGSVRRLVVWPARPRFGPIGLPRPSRTSLLSSPISHAIPPRLFQILKLDRWNCNVFRLY